MKYLSNTINVNPWRNGNTPTDNSSDTVPMGSDFVDDQGDREPSLDHLLEQIQELKQMLLELEIELMILKC